MNFVETVSQVYDVAYPSPIPVKELSGIAVAIQLWRLDLKQHRMNNTLEDFCSNLAAEPNITLRDILPYIPPVIDQIVGKFYRKLVSSISDWLQYHFDRIFKFHRSTVDDILRDFDDIACDYDGTIDYVRTARKMIMCDRISPNEQFKIACTYSFEDSIRQLWPVVRSDMGKMEIDVNVYPHLWYWVTYLKGELDEYYSACYCSIEDMILGKSYGDNRSSFEYFWNRASMPGRYQKLDDRRLVADSSFCARFLLPMMKYELILTSYLSVRGGDMVYNLWTSAQTIDQVLPVWMYIKDKIDETNFIRVIEGMLQNEAIHYTIDDAPVEKSDRQYECYDNNNLRICYEIWTSAAANLRQSAIRRISQTSFEGRELNPSRPRQIQFLMTVLLDATLEQRHQFWLTNWLDLLSSTSVANLRRIIESCFCNETEIDEFKINTMARYENLSPMAERYFKKNYFVELTNLLDFCCPNERTNKDLKRQLLHSSFLIQDSILNYNITSNPTPLHRFIDDAYAGDFELARDFRGQFLSSSGTVLFLSSLVNDSNFFPVMSFVESFKLTGQESFEPTVQSIQRLKFAFINNIRMYLIEGSLEIKVKELKNFIKWCLTDDDKIVEFKQSISPDQVLRNIVRNDTVIGYPLNIDSFLLWYFNSQEDIDEFKIRFTKDDDHMIFY